MSIGRVAAAGRGGPRAVAAAWKEYPAMVRYLKIARM